MIQYRCYSVGEYLCMHLFVWSDVLWQGDALPTYTDVVNAGRAAINDPIAFGHWLGERVRHKDEHRVQDENAKVQLFREALPQVRRALANVPSYMILDDHEATDDWNMTRDICKGIYGNPLGLRVIQNALVAYALCQHWGNVPEQFARSTASDPEPPGLTLLGLLDKGTAETYEQHASTIQSLVGVHDDTALQTRPDKAVFHDEHSLLYNFTVEGKAHQIIFTDTRTWRSFPHGSDAASEFLPKEQHVQQITDTPPTGDRALLVVLSTNAPPVEPIRSATRHHIVSNFFEHFPDIYEAWELPSVSFDRLMTTLTDKLPLVAGQRRGAVILVSGDVHFSFASRLRYKASARFGDVQPQPASAVITQLVASSLRKQTTRTLGFHRDGYRYTPDTFFLLKWVLRSLIPKHTPEAYVGWNVQAGEARRVGEIGAGEGGSWVSYVPLTIDQPSIAVAPDRLALGLLGLFAGIALDTEPPPDYSYRLDYLVPEKGGTLPVPSPTLPPLPTGATPAQRQQAAITFSQAIARYLFYNAGGSATNKIVGTNNISEITFDWDATDLKKRKVRHTMYWRNDNTGPVQRTDYVVNLDPDDTTFPEIPPRTVP